MTAFPVPAKPRSRMPDTLIPLALFSLAGSYTPGPNTMADVNSTVEIFYSSGPPTVEVPDVTGQSAATATATLVAAGFKVTAIDQSSSSVDVGKVISTNPDAGTQVGPNTTVKIYVSTGPPTTTSSSTTTTSKPPPTSSTTTTGP